MDQHEVEKDLFVLLTQTDSNQKTGTKRKRKVSKLTPENKKMLEQEGDLWHRRMGHISSPVVNKLKSATIGVKDLISIATTTNCKVCAEAKQHRKSFNKDRDRATRPCEILHVDLMGPISPPTFEKRNNYIMCVIDDYTRFLQVFVIKSKSAADVTPCLSESLRFLQAQFPGAGQFNILRSDNGTEFNNDTVNQILDKYGIIREESEPHCHEHNGLIERLNRTLQERARALLFESGFPANLWGLAVQAACYIYNRTPHSSIDFITPYEQLYNKVPDITNVRIFGARTYVLNELVPKGQKFDPRSRTFYLVGYTKTGYILYDPSTKKTIKSCNVKIDESKLYQYDYPVTPGENETLNFSDDPANSELLNSTVPEPIPSTSGINVANILSEPRSTTSETNNHETNIEEIDIDYDWDESTPIRINQCYIESFATIQSQEIPMTYKEATSPENIAKWGPPIQAELKVMSERNVWQLVPREPSMLVIPTKWVFTTKENGTPKARIVAVGCRDLEIYSTEDKVSPTPKQVTVRWLFATVIQNSWNVTQLDVKNAFLYSDLDRVKYVTLPQGADGDGKQFVCKLNRALYGLATAPKCWNKTFNTFMISLHFTRNEREPCVYTLQHEGLITIVIVYVDDIIITGNDPIGIQNTCNSLKNRFEIKDLGKPQKFLGLQLDWSDNDKKLLLHQSNYIDELIKLFRLECETPVKTPMVPINNHKYIKTNRKDINFCTYKQAIGALLYVANTTRPDIIFSVNFLSRAQTDPQDVHWSLLKRIFLYLKGTRTMGLLYQQGSNSVVDAYVDADFAGDPRTRKSTTGFLIRSYGNTVGWSSRLQSCCAESSGEAEFIAICDATKDILFLARLIEETLASVQYPISIYEDNNAAISISYNSTSTSRTKHIELKYLKKREYIQNNIIKIVKTESKNQLADCLTKPLPEDAFCQIRNKILKYTPS